MEPGTKRMVDANANRAAEAARVLEDVCRFVLSSAPLAESFRRIRHQLRDAVRPETVIAYRDADGDVERAIPPKKRGSLKERVDANAHRLTEALRVLEECIPEGGEVFSRLRYEVYSLHAALHNLLHPFDAAWKEPSVYVLVSTNLVSEDRLEEFIEAVCKGGASMVQSREKHAATRAVVRTAERIRRITDTYGVPLVVNDRVDAAMAAGAAGVHLGAEDMHPAQARRVSGGTLMIGATVHSIEEARKVELHADYLGAGCVFSSTTKGNAPPLEMEELRKIVEESPLPVYAVGGIDLDGASILAQNGIRRAAVCGYVCSSVDPEGAVRTLLECLGG